MKIMYLLTQLIYIMINRMLKNAKFILFLPLFVLLMTSCQNEVLEESAIDPEQT